ncbi:MAG: DUF3800 domain-containing protein [Anaerolineales bacterium]|nr:DUF3800 domain-containing protein [Anaerolineales bacterium]
MRYNIYCDEASIHDAHYMLIGGLWLPQDKESLVRQAIRDVREKHHLRREMKWTKVSATTLSCYKDFVDVLFTEPSLTFKCIVIDTHLLDYKTYHKGDEELGFYKFYYQLVSRNLIPGNLYWLYTDERQNRKGSRLTVLNLTVNRWWKKKNNVAPLRTIEPRRSHDEDLIQVADVLLGAFAYAWNERAESLAKLALVEHIARRLGWTTLRLATRPAAPKVNVWKWQPANQQKMRPDS